VQLIDDATFREVRNRGGRSLGDQGRFTRRHVFVPPQSEYPLQFLASVRVDDGSRQLLVFARPTEGAPWKVSSAAGIVEEPVPELTEDDSGYAALLDADHAAALKVPPDGLAAALADLWSRSADVEAPATSDFFEAGPLTTEAVGGLVADLAAHGIDGDVQLAFEPAPYPVVAYAATGGRALVLFAVAVHETLRPAGGAAALVQPRSRARFGGLVVPGRYASVAYERLELLAAVVPPGGTADRVRVIGDYGGIVSAKATPAPASGSTA
jgi:hypothetical protein